MRKVRGEIWRFSPSGDLFYVEKRGSRHHMSLKVLSAAEADRIIRGEEAPPKVEREVMSISAFEPVPPEKLASL
jgi:hypothetical protein